MTQNYDKHLSQVKSRLVGDELRLYMENLAYTLALRRSALPWRSSTTIDVDNFDSESFLAAMTSPVRANSTPTIALIFTGQGAQWATMGKELLCYEVFATSLRNAEAWLQSFGCPWKLIGFCTCYVGDRT